MKINQEKNGAFRERGSRINSNAFFCFVFFFLLFSHFNIHVPTRTQVPLKRVEERWSALGGKCDTHEPISSIEERGEKLSIDFHFEFPRRRERARAARRRPIRSVTAWKRREHFVFGRIGRRLQALRRLLSIVWFMRNGRRAFNWPVGRALTWFKFLFCAKLFVKHRKRSNYFFLIFSLN